MKTELNTEQRNRLIDILMNSNRNELTVILPRAEYEFAVATDAFKDIIKSVELKLNIDRPLLLNSQDVLYRGQICFKEAGTIHIFTEIALQDCVNPLDHMLQTASAKVSNGKPGMDDFIIIL